MLHPLNCEKEGNSVKHRQLLDSGALINQFIQSTSITVIIELDLVEVLA